MVIEMKLGSGIYYMFKSLNNNNASLLVLKGVYFDSLQFLNKFCVNLGIYSKFLEVLRKSH